MQAMQKVMSWLWLLILISGIIVLAVGVMSVASVPGAKTELETELARPAGTTVEMVDDIYDQAMAGQEQTYAATNGEAATDPANPMWESYWQSASTATSMGLVKSNLGTVQMTTVLGIVNIIAGFALMLLSFSVYGLGKGMMLLGDGLASVAAKVPQQRSKG